jgi:cell division protein FtsN
MNLYFFSISIFILGTQESMEKYGRLLEKAMQSQMHEEVPSDCEDWRAKQRKENQSKALSTPLRPSSKSKPSNKKSKQSKYVTLMKQCIIIVYF